MREGRLPAGCGARPLVIGLGRSLLNLDGWRRTGHQVSRLNQDEKRSDSLYIVFDGIFIRAIVFLDWTNPGIELVIKFWIQASVVVGQRVVIRIIRDFVLPLQVFA